MTGQWSDDDRTVIARMFVRHGILATSETIDEFLDEMDEIIEAAAARSREGDDD